MNSISFDGRIVADPELRFATNGDAILNFQVASDVGFGEKKITNWFRCAVWGKRAESLQQFLIKGTPVTVYGVLTLRPYKDNNGGGQLSVDVRVNDLTLQGKKEDSQTTSRQEPSAPRQQQRQAPPVDDLDSEIPF